MKTYVTLCALIIKGSRVERGTKVELDEVEAERLVDDVVEVAVETVSTPVIEQPEKSLEELTVAELKEKAGALGLDTKGTKADLVERISLHSGE